MNCTYYFPREKIEKRNNSNISLFGVIVPLRGQQYFGGTFGAENVSEAPLRTVFTMHCTRLP